MTHQPFRRHEHDSHSRHCKDRFFRLSVSWNPRLYVFLLSCFLLQAGFCVAAKGNQHLPGIAAQTSSRHRSAKLRAPPAAPQQIRSPAATTMADGDAQERADELEALAAIFCDDFRLVGEDTFELSLTMADGHELVLHCALPPSYPSEASPVYELRAEWLHPADEAALAAGLESLSMEGKGEVQVFKWTEWLRDDAPSLLSYSSPPSAAQAPLEDADAAAAAVAALELEEEECGSDAVLAVLSDHGALEAVGVSPVQEQHADLHGAVRLSGPVSPALVQKWEEAIQHGEPFTDRKSTFQAHLASVESLQDVESMVRVLKSNNKIARATHNIMAYRLKSENGNLLSDCDDDGESAAGGRLLHLLDIISATNVCVVVSRWYGGIQLGPDRFKHINNVARQLLAQHGHAGGESGASAKGKGGKKGK
mmetsp:Transcript_38518/g.90956  ORF Transcript_38518/g.90956 Transcript_38518/m.90956 type:complete len:423 (+) Transcript_38518:210-1478(+)